MGLYQVIFAVYALMMLGGGYMGYKKAKSKASLVMGFVSFVIIGLGVGVTFKNIFTGYLIIAGMSALLTITFLIRFLKTKKMMPAGMLLVLSVVASGLSIYQLFIQ